ncbi:MAG: glycosyltransferase family 9 protein [Planctomycetes bacterium]|nr:glycosyltransferase family 9 protein [Planctomycetota bacterium]
MPTTPHRILIVRLSHLGDVVHTLPVFHALRASQPEAELAWVVQREFADLLRGLPGLARTIEFDRRGGARAWRALRRELADFGADWALDAQGNLKSAAVTRLSGARRRTGLARSDWRERAGSFLVPERAAPSRGLHAIDRMRALCEHIAGAGVGLRLDPALSAAELALECDDEPLLDDLDALVHLATPGDVRSWPAERFVELGRALARRGARALFLSGPAEADLGRAVAAELAEERGVTHWIGQRGLRRLARAFTLAANGPAVFVGCDSGPMHLAWASGMRVVCLSGPQDARRTGPWPIAGRHTVVRAHAEPDCAPCRARTCSHAEGPVCMRRVTAEDVIAALERMIGPARSAVTAG